MRRPANPSDFREAMRKAISNFESAEKIIRDEYERPTGEEPPDDITERATRRYLIDPCLAALDWLPDDPDMVAEEARTRHGTVLFLDYLGVDMASREPVLIVEAKTYDEEPPRAPRSPAPPSREMSRLIAEAIDDILLDKVPKSKLLTQWVDYLTSIRNYVQSFGEAGRETLQRAVVTSGKWMIIFEDPCATFLDQSKTEAALIHCFNGFQEIVEGSQDIFDLLHRERLINTLRLVMDIRDAPRRLDPTRIDGMFQGALVVTRSFGPARASYPHRVVYPSVILDTCGRHFAICDMDSKQPCTEPREAEDISDFLQAIQANGKALIDHLSRWLDRNLSFSSSSEFTGFTAPRARPRRSVERFAASPGSTSKMAPCEAQANLHAISTEEGDGGLVIAVGHSWYFKESAARGPHCTFHDYRSVKRDGLAEGSPHPGVSLRSYTCDGQDRHCAHAGMLSLRANRCRLQEVDTHLCCRACVFENECWPTEQDRGNMYCPIAEQTG